MLRYILVRGLQAVVALFALSMVIFLLARVSGDPTDLLLPMGATIEMRQAVVEHLGLDKPLYVQYRGFIANAVQGDLGTSIRAQRPATELIAERLPKSAKLVGVSLLLVFLLGTPLGVMAAVRKGSFIDNLARVIAGLGQATPSFWLGLIMMEIFAVRLRWLPTAGMGDWRHYLMPAFVLAWFVMAGIIRLLRSSMLDVLDSEYIKMARIKGVSERTVIWKHALRNSLLPVVSFAGVYIAILVTASVVVETVFAWPGFGRLAYEAIVYSDYPVMQGVVLVTAGLVITANLLTDILYVYLDPRIRYGGR